MGRRYFNPGPQSASKNLHHLAFNLWVRFTTAGVGQIWGGSFLPSAQDLTGLQSFPDPQTLRRFLLNAPTHLREQLHRTNDRLLQRFIHMPEHRSRLIFDLDSTVLTVFGHQEGAEVGYNPRYRGKRSYDPLLCLEANSSFLWD